MIFDLANNKINEVSKQVYISGLSCFCSMKMHYERTSEKKFFLVVQLTHGNTHFQYSHIEICKIMDVKHELVPISLKLNFLLFELTIADSVLADNMCTLT